jgi:hypothetical protein
MKQKYAVSFLFGVLGQLLLLSCSLPGASSATEPTVAVPITGDSTPTEAVVSHQMVPGEPPTEGVYKTGDQDSSPMANKKQAPGGDRFTFGRFERPFNADTMETYFPDLDIQEALLVEDPTWIYAAMTLKSADSTGSLHGRYGFEIDSNNDGGGEWLVEVAQPASTEWSTAGVQVLFDADDDVGGAPTVNADDPSSNGNGYETVLVSSDQGADPDLAWSRLILADPVTVQFAVKRSLLGGDDSYMALMWAGTDDFDAVIFDMNDHYTHEQAGAALPDFEYFYPIKELSELDNACRITVGFQPTGSEPGLCPASPQKPGEPGCITVCPNVSGAYVPCYCVSP